jgi:hypothetical protein
MASGKKVIHEVGLMVFKFKSNLLVKRFFLLNAAFARAILDLISRLHVASFVTMVPECRREEG